MCTGSFFNLFAFLISDPPPLKWSDSKYGFLPEEDSDAEEKIQGRRDRSEASPGRRFGGSGEQSSRCRPVDWKRVHADYALIAVGLRSTEWTGIQLRQLFTSVLDLVIMTKRT